MSKTGLKLHPIFVAAVASLIGTSEAGATYSIVAADLDTEEVGGAGTSCVGPHDATALSGVALGTGALHAQANLNFAGRDRACPD